jgi:hypothetical protein
VRCPEQAVSAAALRDELLGLRWQSRGGGIRADEGRGGHQLAGSPDLHVAHVDVGHLVTSGAEIPGNRDTAIATEIDDTAPDT